MDIFLWMLQNFLAIVFGYSGMMKSSTDRENLVKIGQTGVDGLPSKFIRFIGIAEILGAFGIVLPMAVNILPVLTPVTATCFSIIMLFAMRIHFKRKEFKTVAGNFILFSISLFVACMRFIKI